METFFYTCEYCTSQFTPKRRGIQRFCCASCRASSFNRKKKKKLVHKTENEDNTKKPFKIEQMSLPGVGNALAGTLAAKFVSDFLTRPENKPVTKKDIENLVKILKERYYPIKNMPPRHDGVYPFFDIHTLTYAYSTSPIIFQPIVNNITNTFV